MKTFLVVLLLAWTVFAKAYDEKDGYMVGKKYKYSYESAMKVYFPKANNGYTQLKITADILMHILSEKEAFLQVSEFKVLEVAKEMSRNSRPSESSSPLSYLLYEYIPLPIRFGYENGIISKVEAREEDPEWSVNMKKGILGLLQVDVGASRNLRGHEGVFTKLEHSVLGVCPTTYYVKHQMVQNGSNWHNEEISVMKVFDTYNCTLRKMAFIDNLEQQPIDAVRKKNLDTSASMRYRIMGNEKNIKIESVVAEGQQIFYPVSGSDDNIVGSTYQSLVLEGESKTHLDPEHPDVVDFMIEKGGLGAIMPHAHKPAYLFHWHWQDKENLVEMIHVQLKEYSKMYIAYAPTKQFKKFTDKDSRDMLKLISNLRLCEQDQIESLWEMCEEKTRKLLIHLLPYSQTDTSLKFITEKIHQGELPKEDIERLLVSTSFVATTSKSQVNDMLYVCELAPVLTDRALRTSCYVTTSNLMKTFCKVSKHCSTDFDVKILKMLKKLAECKPDDASCILGEVVPSSILLSIVENIIISHNVDGEYVSLLEKIIKRVDMPKEIKVRALFACRSLIKIFPGRLRVFLMKIFYDISSDPEVRMVAFYVLLENPTAGILQLSVHRILQDPSLQVRRFVYDHIHHIAMDPPYMKYSEKIVWACNDALMLFKGHRPIKELLINSEYYGKSAFFGLSRSFSHLSLSSIVSSKNVESQMFHGKLDVELFGSPVNLFDAEMRFEGVRDFFLKSMGMEDKLYEDVSFYKYSKKKNIKETDKTKHSKIRQEKDLRMHTVVKILDRIVYFNHAFMKPDNLQMNFLPGGLSALTKLHEELKRGKYFNLFKPIVPIDLSYKLPTLVGVPLSINFTALIYPRIETVVKAEAKPNLLAVISQLQFGKGKINLSIKNSLSAVAYFSGSIHFGLPIYDVGVDMAFSVAVNTAFGAEGSLDLTNKKLRFSIDMPTSNMDVVKIRCNRHYYIKPYPISETLEEMNDTKIEVKPMNFGKLVVLSTSPSVTYSLSEKMMSWHSVEDHEKDFVKHGVCISLKHLFSGCVYGYYTVSWPLLTAFWSPADIGIRLVPHRGAAEKVVFDLQRTYVNEKVSFYKAKLQTINSGKTTTYVVVNSNISHSPVDESTFQILPTFPEAINVHEICLKLQSIKGDMVYSFSMDNNCSAPFFKITFITKREDSQWMKIHVQSNDQEASSSWRHRYLSAESEFLSLLHYYSLKEEIVDNWKTKNISPGNAIIDMRFVSTNTFLIKIFRFSLTHTFPPVNFQYILSKTQSGPQNLASTALNQFFPNPYCDYDDGVVKTFDRVKYYYNINDTNCTHVLAQSCRPQVSNFTVKVAKFCRKSHKHGLIFEDDKDKYEFIPGRTVNERPMFKINWKCQKFVDILLKESENGNIKFVASWEERGKTLRFSHYEKGVFLTMVKTKHIKVKVLNIYKYHMCGMCGNFDGDHTNEYFTPFGEMKEFAEDFSRSWSACPRKGNKEK